MNMKRVDHNDSEEEEEESPKRDRVVCTAEVCGTVCSKSFLISVNLTFVVLGWLLVGCGIWLHVFPESFVYSSLLLDNRTGPLIVLDRVSIALFTVGVILFVIGFLGSCGTCTESICFLGFYSTIVIMSIGAQVIAVILANSFKYQLQASLERSFYYQIRNEYNSSAQFTNDTTTPVYRLTAAWDKLQIKLSCCGSRGPRDYRHSSWDNHSTSDLFVPSSCCIMSVVGNDESRSEYDYLCQLEALKLLHSNNNSDKDDNNNNNHEYEYDDDDDPTTDRINTKGCSKAVFEWMVNNLPVITVVVLLDVLQVVNLFYACCLIKDIREKLSEYSWCEEDEEIC